MEIKQVKVYKFNELSEEAKQKAIEKHYDLNIDFEWWDVNYDYFVEQLEEIGLTCEKFYFDLDRGSYIEPINLKVIDEKLYLKACKVDLRTKEARKILEETGFYISVSKHNVTIESNSSDYNTVVHDYSDTINNKLSSFLSDLQISFDYLTSEESIIEMIEANEYDFIEDGTRF